MVLDYIKCHGSGNEFILFDAVAQDMSSIDLSALSRYACDRESGIGADGIPYYPQTPEEFASIVMDCHKNSATVLGGCCGTAPEFIAAVKNALK